MKTARVGTARPEFTTPSKEPRGIPLQTSSTPVLDISSPSFGIKVRCRTRFFLRRPASCRAPSDQSGTAHTRSWRNAHERNSARNDARRHQTGRCRVPLLQRRLRKIAGFDGVQGQAGFVYLIQQFLHEPTNRRTDEYRAVFKIVPASCLKFWRRFLVWPSQRVGVKTGPMMNERGLFKAVPSTIRTSNTCTRN